MSHIVAFEPPVCQHGGHHRLDVHYSGTTSFRLSGRTEDVHQLQSEVYWRSQRERKLAVRGCEDVFGSGT
jgi:hypothetical protein